jgi:uncharacterized protein
MRRVHRLHEQPHGRLGARLLGVRLLGVRLDGGWEVVPPSPVEVAAAVAPIPLLLVHFTGDRYFSAAHAGALAAGRRARRAVDRTPRRARRERHGRRAGRPDRPVGAAGRFR